MVSLFIEFTTIDVDLRHMSINSATLSDLRQMSATLSGESGVHPPYLHRVRTLTKQLILSYSDVPHIFCFEFKTWELAFPVRGR